MIHEIISIKLKMSGMTQSHLAKLIETSPTQLGNYLKGQGSLTEKSLNKCFDLLEININRYKYLYEAAQKASYILRKKHIGFEQTMRMNKEELVNATGIEQIRMLVDVKTEAEYENIIKYGIIDHQSTFPYFKSTVAYFMNSGEKTTTKSNIKTWSLLFGTIALGSIVTTPIGLFASSIGAGISSAIGTVGGVALANILKENKPLNTFNELTKKIIKNF